MAPPYGHPSNFYDPVGSQANQPQGYTYQTSATSTSQPASASYGASSYPSYGSHSYSGQHYGSSASTNTQQNATTGNAGGSHAASGSGMSGASGQDNQASASRSNSTLQYDGGMGSWGSATYAPSSSYNNNGGLNVPGRSQRTTSPLYANSTPASTFGRLSNNAPPQQSQSNTATHNQQQSYAQPSGTTVVSADAYRRMYGTSQQNVSTTEPSRYAVQSQSQHQQQQQQQPPRHQGHGRQASRSSNQQPSPVVNARASQQVGHRQSSASVEPMVNTTVDPSHVYDFRAEREKKAKAEAEKRRQKEEAEAAKRAEEARIAEEKRKVDEAKRQAEERKAQETRLAMEKETQRVALEAHRKKEEQCKARESKNAANTLAALATSSNIPDMDDSSPPLNDEEAEMRAMFKKMREFNTKNPAMLAKLWEEERRSHSSNSRSPQTTSAAQAATSQPTASAPQNGASSTPLSGSTTTPNQMKPFSNPPKSKAPAARATPVASAPRDAPDNSGPQANANLWPPGKKGLLADVAARWLQNFNPQRAVTAKEILDLLDLNPNYVKLCENLESSGLKFDRAEFARELLRGVHPVGATTQPSHKTGDAAIMSANGTVALASGAASPVVGDPKAKRPRATKAEMEQRRASNLAKKQAKQNTPVASNDGMVQYEMPSFSATEPVHYGQVNHIPTVERTVSNSMQPPHTMSPLPAGNTQQASGQQSQSVQPMQPGRQSIPLAQPSGPSPVGSNQQTPEAKQPSPPRPPANKEEAARKRGFGELVDLTAGDSDDEEMPPKKMIQTIHGFDAQRQQPFQPQYQQQHHAYTNPAARTAVLPSSGPGAQAFRPPPGVPNTAQMIMMPNGSFGVARPQDRNTPNALAPNRNAVPSNVAIPVPPPQAPPKRNGPTNEQIQNERIRGKIVVEPIMRDRVLRRSTYDSRTIARDVLLATGRHPDMRPLNGHLHVMSKLLGDRGGMTDASGNKSDLATIKWDILDPQPPKKADPSKKPDASIIDPTDGIVRTTEVDENDAGGVARQHAANEARKAPALDLEPHNNAAAASNNKPLAPPKKRGRPRRSSLENSKNSASAMSTERQHNGGNNGTSHHARGTLGSTNRAASGSNPPVGYAAFRQTDASGNPVKKKGRPVGWRKSVHSREAQGLTPAKPGTSGSKSKAPAVKPNERLQEPTYQIYKCQWNDCSAELHSLEVLKKHVIKVHGRPNADSSFYCSWKGCEANGTTAFEDIADWLFHVDKEHLQPVAWTLGDGPRGGLSEQLESEPSEAYLSDSRGRSVTPIIRPMSNIGIGETSYQQMPDRPDRPPAGSSKDERVAFAELQKLKERKKAVGPTMEKTGVRIANSKRRMGFLDDENFEDFVESEGETSH
ncbi:hypothetical protein Q7P37_007234 [Cladosporium fusiforme]